MRGVRVEGHDLLRQGLVEVQLTGGDEVARDDGAVGADGPVGVDLGVDVDGALDVEAGEDGLHFEHAVAVRGPHAAEEGSVVRVQVGDANLVCR